ncbi:MAG TPA: acyl-CoA dehydrogenase family protein [Planctomycetota bacterium]|nr:acyl-CoA dehydrogenase family protein [Planctomycetota bacterium]
MRGRDFIDERIRGTPFLDPEHFQLQAQADRFAESCGAIAEDEESARKLVRRLGGEGLLNHAGGAELRSLCILRETLAFHHGLLDLALAMQGLGSYALEIAGSPVLKSQVLPRVRSGEWVAAFAATEPEAGSDLAALTTSARAKDGGYVIDGLKTLISNGPIADVMTVLAKTDPAAGSKGITMFVVLKTDPGVRPGKRQEAVAYHPLGELIFERCTVPADRVVGSPGEGYKIALAVLETFRTSVAAAAAGMAGRAIADTIDRVLNRRQFGARLADLAVVQSRLADMITEYEAARLLIYRSAAKRDGGTARIPVESAEAKLFATEAAQRIIDSAVQLHGGSGVLKGSAVERLYREVRTLRIYEGASDILKLVIAANVLK